MNPQEKQALDRVQFQHNELSQRVDALFVKMNEFRDEALTLLQGMAQAHAPKGEASGN